MASHNPRSSDARLLADLVGEGSPARWRQILTRCGGLEIVRRGGAFEELSAPGRRRLEAAVQLHERWCQLGDPGRRSSIEGPGDVHRALGPERCRRPVECFWSLCLDPRGRLLGVVEVSRGTVDACLVHPREVFGPALLAQASSLVVAHNHPSGDPTPSLEDRRLTERLLDAGLLLGIPMVDHVVVAASAYRSVLQVHREDEPGTMGR